MEKNKRRRAIIIGLTAAVVCCAVFGALVLSKVVKLNHPRGLKGADISSYQGTADWSKLSQNMDFAFIKATEGSSHTDERFDYNFKGAREAGLYAGAYHFFSFDSPGKTQAENFISAMEATGMTDGMLPPVIDVEPYGEYLKQPKPAEEVLPELEDMISAIEEKYGCKPVIYCTGKAYKLYKAGFEGCKLWERNVYYRPLHNDWSFWQYTDTEVLEGYSGDEKYIDMNVFCGDEEELKAMCISTK
ncbi:GH25 family lysozyme [Ruminococcus sp.]|uniref:glycoside hydrolase family 25 protein n=1 Tax=Ruminococcus sp. TaxID=41978 RepID=UPI0025E42250|nr:GH25 family lysozyme [Ruminococcus sp.]MBQ8966750.1 glycoside hydrolase [Ruminococcus sp.]